MGYFDDIYEDEDMPPRRKRSRLDWQDMVDELDVSEDEEATEPSDEEEEPLIEELEIDEHGRIRNGGGDLDLNPWDEE